jgi:hypothetical protein
MEVEGLRTGELKSLRSLEVIDLWWVTDSLFRWN